MNYLDIILSILLLWGLVRGFMKGLFVSLASLVALIAGIYVAVHFSDYIGGFLKQYVDWEETSITLIAFALTFIGIVILVALAGKILTKIADFAALGILNKLLGAAFGVAKVAFIVSIILIFFNALNDKMEIIKKETLASSILYPPVQKLAPAILPKIMNYDTPEE